MSSTNILFVDDDHLVLQAFERQLKKRYAVTTADSAAQALSILKDNSPYAVVVSDMRMPGMDGIDFLSRLKGLYPDTVRIMLTGNADQNTAIAAVNSGRIFRFLTKPIPPRKLTDALDAAIEQYRLITAEKELLNQTLKGSIKVLCELLSLANATAFSSGYRIKATVVALAERLGCDRIWQYEIAALMSQIGCVTIPDDILRKVQAGSALTPKEEAMFRNHPRIGARLIGRIPRLEHVAAMIEQQMLPFRAYEGESALLLTDEEKQGAQLLKTAIDHDILLLRGMSPTEALQALEAREDLYNPRIVALLATCDIATERYRIAALNFEDIVPGMIAEEDILAKNGALIIPRGQEITWSMIQGLTNFLEHIGIRDPIRVRMHERAGSHSTP